MGEAVTQWSSISASKPSFSLYQAADFFASETIIATLKSFEIMPTPRKGCLFPFSMGASGEV